MPLIEADMAAIKSMYDVNVFAVIGVTQAFAPQLIASKGTIINISSIAALVAAPFEAGYNSSKAALDMISDTLRHEMKPFDVKVINVRQILYSKIFVDGSLLQWQKKPQANILHHQGHDRMYHKQHLGKPASLGLVG